MWFACHADDSYEMSIFSLTNKNLKKLECRLLQILLGVLRVKGLCFPSRKIQFIAIIWIGSRQVKMSLRLNVPTSVHSAHAQSHRGIYLSMAHSTESISVSEQRRPWSNCGDAQKVLNIKVSPKKKKKSLIYCNRLTWTVSSENKSSSTCNWICGHRSFYAFGCLLFLGAFNRLRFCKQTKRFCRDTQHSLSA